MYLNLTPLCHLAYMYFDMRDTPKFLQCSRVFAIFLTAMAFWSPVLPCHIIFLSTLIGSEDFRIVVQKMKQT